MSEPVSLEQLRDALIHLHDLDHLEAHPLAQRLPAGGLAEEPSSRGLRLRKVLIESIESLKPEVEMPGWAPEWRRFVVLYDRYVRRQPLWEIEQKLGLGDRQVRREQRRALAALAVLLRLRLESLAAEAPPAPPPATLQEAVRRLNPVPRVFGLAELIEEVVAMLAEVRGRSGIPVHWRVQPTDLTVYTDRGILHQLLMKLLWLLLQQKGPADAVTVQAWADDGHAVVAIVGGRVALLMEDGELRLCQWLAQSLHTEIRREDVGQAGIQLSFRLPIGTSLHKVLIVDDELPAIELFRGYLSGLDYQVIGETVAERAVERAIAVRPDAIVLDVMMPAMDGWELLQRLRHTAGLRDVPIIVCSVLNDAELAFALGATRFLKKPVLRQQLVTALQEAIQASRSVPAPLGSRSAASPSPSD